MELFPAALAENELPIGTAAQAAITTAAANAAALLALFVFFIINAPSFLCRLCFSCQSHFNFLSRRYVFRSVHGSLFIQNSLMLL